MLHTLLLVVFAGPLFMLISEACDLFTKISHLTSHSVQTLDNAELRDKLIANGQVLSCDVHMDTQDDGNPTTLSTA